MVCVRACEINRHLSMRFDKLEFDGKKMVNWIKSMQIDIVSVC